MLSSAPKNRKRRVRRKKNKLEQWDTTPSTKKTRKSNSPNDTYQKLHAQIGAIESFLEKKQLADAQKLEMRQQNILPPPESMKKKRKARAMTLAEKRRYNAARNKNGIKFLFLFCLACGIGWWLIFSGI